MMYTTQDSQTQDGSVCRTSALLCPGVFFFFMNRSNESTVPNSIKRLIHKKNSRLDKKLNKPTHTDNIVFVLSLITGKFTLISKLTTQNRSRRVRYVVLRLRIADKRPCELWLSFKRSAKPRA